MKFSYDDRSECWSNAGQRAVSVVVGCGYIYLVSALFAAVTESSLLVAVLTVSAGVGIEILIICELSKRLFLSNNGDKRFGLSTLILVVTGLAIYLAAIGCLVQSVPDEAAAADLPLILMLIFSVLAVLFVAISTIVFTYFAEALVWAGTSTAIRLWIRRKKQ